MLDADAPLGESSANPDAQRKPPAPASVAASAASELLPLWIWLTIALWMSCVEVGTPADPISLLLALGYGLLSFLVGAVAASSWHGLVRFSLLVLWLAAISVLAATLLAGYYPVAYGLVSVALGVWACRYIGTGQARILIFFSIGYVIGTVIGPVGTATGALLGALHGRRRARSSAASSDSEGDAMPHRTWRFSLREVFFLIATIAAVLALIGSRRPFTCSPFFASYDVEQSLGDVSNSLGLPCLKLVCEMGNQSSSYRGYAYRWLDAAVEVPDGNRRREVMALLRSSVESSVSGKGCTLSHLGSDGDTATGGVDDFFFTYEYRRLRGTFCAYSVPTVSGEWRLLVIWHEW